VRPCGAGEPGAVGAGHSLAVAPDKPTDGLNDRQTNAAPFINSCGYDQAGIILQHVYGVSAVVNGTEGPASIEAAATTRAAPAPCQKPGTIGP
jgi:hypothetical protein